MLFSLIFIVAFSPNFNKNKSNEEDTKMIKKFFDEALVNAESYKNLEHLCLNIGPRLSGSKNAQKAVEWTKKVMEDYGFDKVFLQEVLVPHWERGAKEEAKIVDNNLNLNMLAIGGSEPTPAAGITAEVIEVQSLDEVDELGEKVKGKIVFYNRAFDQRVIGTGAGYGGAVDQRSKGPSKAAQYGALAIVIRSVSSSFDDAPHTGTLSYNNDFKRIPAGALGVQSANKLSKALKENPKLKLFIKINSKWFEDALSYNVVGELTGTEKPEEIILVGGHLDSWDVAQGAHDDGAGCMQSIGALRLFKKLGIKPKHTIRAVMFMNEENGLRGGKKYAELAVKNKEKHLMAIESDAGGFTPRGIGVTGADKSLDKMRAWLEHFDKRTLYYIDNGGGGADIGPLHRETGTPMAGFSPDTQRLFHVHHSPNDTFDSVNRRELEMGTASLAGFIYLLDKYGL